MRPSAEGLSPQGEKILLILSKNLIKFESIPHSFNYLKFHISKAMDKEKKDNMVDIAMDAEARSVSLFSWEDNI